MNSNTTTRPHYYPGIDGLKGLAAVVVLLGHVARPSICVWGATQVSPLPLPMQIINLFLVASGFVAGYRLQLVGSPMQYYRRRARRLLPLYYIYILVTVVALSLLGFSDRVFNSHLLYYIFLLPNIAHALPHTAILPLVHLWFVGTLALFYLVVPWLARLQSRRRNVVVSLSIVLLFVAKALAYFFVGKETFTYRLLNVSGYDSILLGFLVGTLVLEGWNPLKKIGDCRIVVVLAWALYLLSGFYGEMIPALFRPEYAALLSVVIILGQGASKPVPRMENGFFRWLGGISYQVYVVQILVIILLSYLYGLLGLRWSSLAIYLVSTLSVVLLSWLASKLQFGSRR